MKQLFSQATLAIALLLNLASAWDYTKNGTDWTDGACADLTKVQSPRDMYHNGTDWYTGLKTQFVFLPYNLTAVKPTKMEFENLIYTVYGNFGRIIAKEPVNNDITKIVKWDAMYMRFHYPAEHLVQTVQYDLEMQVYINDVNSMSQGCLSGYGAIAVLFKVGQNDNPFFDWLTKTGDDQLVDLSTIFSLNTPLNNYISGYVGTDTIPPCTKFVCWYVIETPMEISQKQLDMFKTKDTPYNARKAQQGKDLTQKQLLNAQGLNVKA